MLRSLVRLRKNLRTMPTTRSATRAAGTDTPQAAAVVFKPKTTKRKAPATSDKENSTSRKKPRGSAEPSESTLANPEVTQTVPLIPPATGPPPAVVPAVLSFSLEDAKEHLIEADERFKDVFARNSLKPYEVLDRVEPFRTLVTTILGQQISWKAARSISHRFVRLYNPSLPETPTDESLDGVKSPEAFFPTPQQVIATDITTLREAGLSGRKAEYVADLAARFADGRLSTEKLLEADDEELYELLTAVRGIGRWTVEMFAMFSLRRPNILPVGDLGVQRGMCKWFLSLHAPEHKILVSPEKKSATKPKSKAKKGKKTDPEEPPATPKNDTTELPTLEEDSPIEMASAAVQLPPAFTPSIQKTLNKELEFPPPELPDGLSVSVLKARLAGKKVKGAFLTPAEMDSLTEHWKPYRSLGVYFMWSVADAEGVE